LLGPVLRDVFVTGFLGWDSCRGDIINTFFVEDKEYVPYGNEIGYIPGVYPDHIGYWIYVGIDFLRFHNSVLAVYREEYI
jgi:hypothetical protein